MRQGTRSVGLYSKIVLTVIAVSLVGLLVRQLPGKVEAKPERYVGVSVLELTASDLRGQLRVFLKKDNEAEKEGELPVLGSKKRALAQEIHDWHYAGIRQLLEQVLTYRYAMGDRVKLMTDDFIILEAE